MAELENNKAGLQKKVSSVFKGVPLPQNSGVQQTAGTPASDAAPGASARPASADRQSPQSSLLRTLHQGGEPSGNAAPDRPAQARPKPASTDRQTFQRPAPRKPDRPEKPLKEATPAKPHKAALVAEQTRPSLWQQISDRLFPPKPGVSPTRQKAMVILVPVLAIVMIFVFRQVLSTSPRQTQAATDDGTPVVATAKSSHEIDWQIPDPLPAMERDPTKLPEQVAATSNAEPNQAVAGPEAGTFDVRDIVYSKDKPSAVVNAHIVYTGHKVGSATVVQILRDGVEFERDGKRWVEKIHD
ncbi:MAG: hypothetical protein AAB403_24065 [Planctomycetota bacterium]